jgi:hypothetical protein
MGERQVALMRDILRTTAETENSLLQAGFSAAVVDSVLRLTRFDAGYPQGQRINLHGPVGANVS